MLFRSRVLNERIIKGCNLNVTPPPPNSFLFRAFEKNRQTAVNTLHTPFFKGIAQDDLPPVCYGSLTVKDSYYCYNGVESFQIAQIRAQSHYPTETSLITLLTNLTDSYRSYNKYFLEVWYILMPATITATDVCRNYSFHERRVANYEHPIYTLVSMLPCYYLWYWLGNELIAYKDNKIYGFWIEGNLSPSSAYAIGNFIEDWKKSGKEFDDARAMEIFSQSMGYEYAMFEEAYKPENLKRLLEELYNGK